ncbi:MAG TPA: site-2 protease family protein [Nitrospiria bacterium]|nr:site-2 protease family protein [Nitrospiria bacterium]
MERPLVHRIPMEEPVSPPMPDTGMFRPTDNAQVRKRFPWVNTLLFIATVFTTLLAGAIQQGAQVFQHPVELVQGIPFSFTLMAILLTHEMGHYLTSRYHGVGATLPFFIPAPSIIGTFGAFIRMTSPIPTRRALIDIGASGPIAGFIVAIVAVGIGLHYSQVVEVSTLEGMKLGTPLIFSMMSRLTIGPLPVNYDVLLHPIAFAGWIGMFVTALNLIPIGQLDGGHVVYAILGRHHRTISLIMIPTLILLGIYGWPGWLLWAILPLIFGINHPPVLDTDRPLSRSRQIVGWISLAIFVVTFTPTPFMG